MVFVIQHTVLRTASSLSSEGVFRINKLVLERDADFWRAHRFLIYISDASIESLGHQSRVLNSPRIPRLSDFPSIVNSWFLGRVATSITIIKGRFCTASTS